MQGSVRKIAGKNAAMWSGVVDLPRNPKTGRQRQKRVTTKIRRKCEELLRQLASTIDTEKSSIDEKLTFAAFADQWLEAVEPSLRPSTFRRYTDTLHNHIVPQIGKRALAKLPPPTCNGSMPTGCRTVCPRPRSIFCT
jgi:hypothetical protein